MRWTTCHCGNGGSGSPEQCDICGGVRPWATSAQTPRLRWRGFCHVCRRYDVQVETRYEHAAKTLCAKCATPLRAQQLKLAVSGPGEEARMST